ncbi:hypothetical protein ABTD54_18465, partial [Acinetobacter baumannii]
RCCMGCSASTVTSGGRGGCFRGQILLFGRTSRLRWTVSAPFAGLAHLVGRATGQSLTSGKIDNAKAELARALNTLVVTSVAFPLTVLRA